MMNGVGVDVQQTVTYEELKQQSLHTQLLEPALDYLSKRDVLCGNGDEYIIISDSRTHAISSITGCIASRYQQHTFSAI